MFAAAVAQARSTAPGVRETQQVLADSVRSRRNPARTRWPRSAASSPPKWTACGAPSLAGDAQGRELLSRLDELEFVGASTTVTGPGLTVTVTDPGFHPI